MLKKQKNNQPTNHLSIGISLYAYLSIYLSGIVLVSVNADLLGNVIFLISITIYFLPSQLGLWGMRSTPLLPSLPGPHWPGVVAPV